MTVRKDYKPTRQELAAERLYIPPAGTAMAAAPTSVCPVHT